MQVLATAIPDVKEVKPVRRFDPRGFFSEIFREDLLRQHGIASPFVQENLSLSADRGVVRGLHFQTPPQAQAKLVRVAAGSIFDVAVGQGSPAADVRGIAAPFRLLSGSSLDETSCARRRRSDRT